MGVPPLCGAGGQPVVEEVLDLRGRRVAALAEQVDVRVDGLDDAFEAGLAVAIDQSIAQDVVGAGPPDGQAGPRQAEGRHGRGHVVVEHVHEVRAGVGHEVGPEGLAEEQANGVLRKQGVHAVGHGIAAQGDLELAAGHGGGGVEPDLGEVDRGGRHDVVVGEEVVEIDPELRPESGPRGVPGRGVHVRVDQQHHVVRVQHIRQVEVGPEPQVDVEVLRIVRRLHLEQVYAALRSRRIANPLDLCPILKPPIHHDLARRTAPGTEHQRHHKPRLPHHPQDTVESMDSGCYRRR